MQRSVTHLPDFRASALLSHLSDHGINASNSAVQVIADTAGQLDVIVYAAVDATDYDTLRPTTSCIVLIVSVEHLADGHWLNVSAYVEDECPAQATCPAHILAMLGEARTVDAQTWRVRCEHFLRSFIPTVSLTPSPLFAH
jgi:hypothetical protein